MYPSNNDVGQAPGSVPNWRAGYLLSLSSVNIIAASPSWRMLFAQAMRLPVSFALPSAGRSIPARIAMMAMTTSNSMSVNPRLVGPVHV